MSDRDALLRAIAANPEEDTPRLMFADYLDELGDASSAARAEFIRLRVRLARLPHDHPELESTRCRIDELLWKWDFIWRKEMPAGFKALSGYRHAFAYRAAAVASAIAGAADDPRTLFIEELELTVDVSPFRLRELVKQPFFAELKSLIVQSELPIGWSGARAIAEGEFPKLERLVLARQSIGNIGLRALCDSWGFPRLRELDISSNDITDDGMTALLRSGLNARLRHVRYWGNDLTPTVQDRLRQHNRWL